MGVVDSSIDFVSSTYQSVESSLSPQLFFSLNMSLYALLIAVAAVVIWKFYNTLSKKDFLSLDLEKYDWSEHPVFAKFGATIFYFIENILLMPILIVVWFGVLAIILLLIGTEGGAASQLLLLSGAMVLAIRLLAYYHEEISKDVAKLFPFIALSAFLLTPNAFEFSNFINNLRLVPELFNNVASYLIVILVIEIVLRVVHTLSEIARGKEKVGETKKKPEPKE